MYLIAIIYLFLSGIKIFLKTGSRFSKNIIFKLLCAAYLLWLPFLMTHLS